MPKPTRKIKCKTCDREVEAIILKEYGFEDFKIQNKTERGHEVIESYKCFQKLLIKHHKTGMLFKPRCSGSGRKFTIRVNENELHGTIGDLGHC